MISALRHRPKSSLVGTGLLIVASIIISVIIAEIAAQTYVGAIALKGKRFQPDNQLGWRPLPNLHLVRKNADGNRYLVETGSSGIRGPATFPDDPAVRRLLILGDSFAFGEGVDLKDRFDRKWAKALPNVATVNLGVPGFGTDQQIIGALPYLTELRRGDALLLVFYGNDFADIARTRHAGRAKPWYSLEGGQLVRHPPNIDRFSTLRDRFYIPALLGRVTNFDPGYDLRLENSGILMRALIKLLASTLHQRGASLWIAYHGLGLFDLPFEARSMVGEFCKTAAKCLNLDTVLNGKSGLFQADGHWTGAGHGVVGAFLQKKLRESLSSGRF